MKAYRKALRKQCRASRLRQFGAMPFSMRLEHLQAWVAAFQAQGYTVLLKDGYIALYR